MLEGADKLDAVYAFGIGTHIGEKFAALELAQHCVNLMPTIATELEMTLHGGELPELAAQIIRGLLAQINSPEQVTTK